MSTPFLRTLRSTAPLIVAVLLGMAPLLSSPASMALEAAPVSLAAATQRADAIFRGRVISRETRWNPPGTLPITTITFDVEEAVKGPDASPVALDFAGGEIDGQVYEVSDLPLPEVGAELVVFSYLRTQPAVSPIVGGNQWYFVLLPDPNEGTAQALFDYKSDVVIGMRNGRPVAVPSVKPAGWAGWGPSGGSRLAARSIVPDVAFDGAGHPLSPRAATRAASPAGRAMRWSELRDATMAELAAPRTGGAR